MIDKKYNVKEIRIFDVQWKNIYLCDNTWETAWLKNICFTLLFKEYEM